MTPAELTLQEKAALCQGSTFWQTAPVPRAGIPAIRVADGPHGLRRQPDGNQAGISGSMPATGPERCGDADRPRRLPAPRAHRLPGLGIDRTVVDRVTAAPELVSFPPRTEEEI